MIKVKDGYAKLIGTTYLGSSNHLLLSNGGAWEVHTGRNNEVNKIVRTDSNGFLLTGWINTTSGDTGTNTINKIYCSNDGYIRYKTPANFFSTLTNSGDNISITVASLNRTLTVLYANIAGLLRSKGTIAPLTGRTLSLGDVYSYHLNASVSGGPTTNAAVIGFGKGTSGTVEIAGEWTNGRGLWVRALRDVTDNWYSWDKVLTLATYTGITDSRYYTKTLSDDRFVNITGDTMTGSIILKGGTSADMTYAGNIHPCIRFDNSNSTQNVSLIFTDYDAYRNPAGIKLIGNQGNEWFEAARIYATNFYGNGFIKNGSSNDYILLGGGGHKLISDFATAGLYVKYGKVAKSTADNANANPYIYNIENEAVISGYYNYWYILNLGQYSKGNFGTLIAMPYQDSLTDSELFIRSAKSGTWRDWRRVLHSNNYTAYTVKKDGTGATGTWGINITGNASSATKLTTSAGSPTLPIYFLDGKPTACTASSLFSDLSNSGNNISMTIAGQNRTLTVAYATTSSMLKTSTWFGGLYLSSDTHYMCLGYMNCTSNYDSLTLLVTSAFWGNQHGSQDIITIQQDTNTNSTKTIQTTVGRLRLGGSVERAFYYYKDNTNFRLYLYVYVTGGNSYGKWNISYLGGNATWVSDYQKNVTKDASWVTIEYSGNIKNADTVDSCHASKFPYINNNGIWRIYGKSAAAALADNTAGLSAWAFGETRNPSITYLGILKPSVATCGISAHGTIAVFGQGDTHLGLAVDYGSANLQVFGGNADKIVWRKKVAFTTDIPTVTNYYWANVKISATSSTATNPIFATAIATTSVTTPLVSSTGRLTLNATNTALDLKFNNDDTKSVILNGSAFKPFDAANNKLTLGSSTARWSNVYSVLGNFIGTITSSLTTGTYINGNKGTAIINSTAAAGYNMLAKMNSTNGVFNIGTYNTSFNLYYTTKTTIDAGTNSITYGATLLNESGNSSFPGLVSVNTLKITNTSAGAHLIFSRGNYNYVTAPSEGSIAFCVNGKAAGIGANCEMVISDGTIFPGTTNVTSLGDTSHYWTGIYSYGFYKSGSNNSYVLLGGGGHKALSDFAMASDYVKKAGDIMSGALTIDTTGFGALVIKRNDDTNGASIQFRGKSNVYGYIGLNNSAKDKLFLRWSGSDTSKIYIILDTSSTYVSSGKGVINGTTITQVDNATNATNASSANKLNKWFNSRIADLNLLFGDGALRIFNATSSTTANKCPSDSSILHLAWDNTGYDSLLALDNRGNNIYFRGQDNGTWSSWKTVLHNGNSSISGNTITLNGSSITVSKSDHTHSYLPLSGGTMTGGINFSNTSHLLWNSDSYHLRIFLTDDSIADTAVFTFLQSTDRGTNWNNLMTIRDNGKVIANMFVGSLQGNAATASKLGTSTVGAANVPIYLNGGTPTVVDLNSTANNLINSLSTGTATPLDNDYYVCLYAGGGTTTMTYHRRPVSSLYNYIKNKAEGTWKINVTGNAATATKLQTARTLWGLSFDGTTNVSGNMSGVGLITFSDLTGTNGRSLLYLKMADNDYFRIYVGGTASNSGYAEIATADDGNEPIYVRQYTGVFSTIKRTLTLLDGSGNTSFPGNITTTGLIYAAHFYENSDVRLKHNIELIHDSNNIPEIKLFDWKESGEHSYGLIALELEENGYSELVETKEDGYKSVNYSAALSLIIGKLQVKIRELEKEIENLKIKS